MSTGNHPKARTDDSLLEDYQERGLRILGALIARDIVKKQRVNNNDKCDHESNSKISE